MNKLKQIKEVSFIFGFKIADIFQNKVVSGSKLNFLKLQIKEAVNYPINIIFGKIKPIQKFIEEKRKKRKNEEFIIKNHKGLFAVKSINDSLAISSSHYDSFQKNWIKSEHKNIFLDIGANIGHYTLLAKKEGFSEVICFEPDPDTYKTLRENIHLNKLRNVKTFNIGAGNINGKLPFEKDLINTGGNRFLNNKEEKTKKSKRTLKVVKIDDFLKKNKINVKKIDFIKIDVEGFELEVLKGMINTIKSLNNKTMLMIEVWNRNINRKETLNFIKNNKFKLVKQYDDNYLFKLEK